MSGQQQSQQVDHEQHQEQPSANAHDEAVKRENNKAGEPGDIVDSINEPGKSRLSMMPASINEPPVAPDPPAPMISALSPDSAVIGGEDFTLVISGDNLFAGSVIYFAGHDEPTTFNETDRTVSTLVKPSLWENPVVVQCAVRNGNEMGNALDFTFNAPAEQRHHHDRRHRH